MGYTTDFSGEFTCSPALEDHHADYLRRFSATRRMKRNTSITETQPDPLRKSVKLPIGEEGCFYVGDADPDGQSHTEDILEYNHPPIGQPGLWCDWTPAEDDNGVICWNGGEKFYDYVSWLEYLIEHFLRPWGYTLNGDVEWFGEDLDDRGIITVTDNNVRTRTGHWVFED